MKSIAIVAIICVLGWSVPARGGEAAPSRTFDSDGVQIAYLVAGKGDPVVLIHGLHAVAFINRGQCAKRETISSRAMG